MRISDWSSDVCSSDLIKGWFDGKDKDKSAEPSELTELTPTATVSKLWSAKAGKRVGLLGVRQAPAIADGRVYAAAVEGGVQSSDLQTGATLWTFDSDLALSDGPGVGDGLAVVGGLEGDVIALDAGNGAERWRDKVENDVIGAPGVGPGMAFVRS